MIDNPRARVRRDAAVRVLTPRRLRGRDKLAQALDGFDLDVSGLVAIDVGAAAGGFTTELLERGVRLVYAVDAGFGQLTGSLRGHPRVVDLERTNVAELNRRLIPDIVDLVTMDLSYLPIAKAVGSLGHLHFAPRAHLVALVKPTFELHAPTLVTDPVAVRRAVQVANEAIAASGWQPIACTIPAVMGASGAVEAFIVAERTT